jgi:hypothetical protein
MNIINRMKFTRVLIPILYALFLIGCEDHIISPPEKPLFTKVLKGRVILENQTEHSNALVYLDSLNRGVSTDSSGNYSLQFSDLDTSYNGVFKIYYFVNEYEMDSALYVLINGKVKLDTLDVDTEGNLPSKELNQLLLIEGWTGKQEYRIGDTLKFTARFTNLTNKTVHVFIYSCWDPLGYVSLYNQNYQAFTLSPCDPVTADCDIDIYTQGYYEGIVAYIIRDKNYCSINVPPLLPNEYFVVADLFIEGRFRSPYDKFERFIFNEWYKMHRGKTPKFDWYPNKYKYPIIKVLIK